MRRGAGIQESAEMSGPHEIKGTVTGSVLDERFIRLEVQIDSPIDKIATEFYTVVVDSQDKLIREGLIKLGWTPPPE